MYLDVRVSLFRGNKHDVVATCVMYVWVVVSYFINMITFFCNVHSNMLQEPTYKLTIIDQMLWLWVGMYCLSFFLFGFYNFYAT